MLNVGTPLYSSPEFFVGKKISQKSDIYSSGVVLGEIWRTDPNPSETLQAAKKFAKYRKFLHLFAGIRDLTIQHRKEIYALLDHYVMYKPSQRDNLIAGIALFEKIMLERLLAVSSKLEHKQIKYAFQSGIKLRTKLDVLIKPKRREMDAPIVKPRSLINEKNLQKFKTIFFTVLHADHLQDSPEIIRLFVDRLDIEALRGMSSKQQINDLIIDNINAFYQNRDLLCQLEKKLYPDNMKVVSSLEKIYYKVHRALHKPYAMNLDNLVEVNQHYQNVLRKAKQAQGEVKHGQANAGKFGIFAQQPVLPGQMETFLKEEDHLPALSPKAVRQ